MKHLLCAMGLLTAAASTYSFGQSFYSRTVAAQVPFSFQTGGVVMPAGQYTLSESGNVLVIKAAAGKPSVMQLTSPGDRRNKSAPSSLTFTRYGNDYFLTRIWSAEEQRGLTVPKCKKEKELIHRMTFVKGDEVALQTHNLSDRDGR